MAAVRGAQGDGRALASAERRLAAVHELQGNRGRALDARRAAATAFADSGMPAEAAADRLAAAGTCRAPGATARPSRWPRRRALRRARPSRHDLLARALGLSGVATAKRGDFEEGLATVRSGLSLALEHELTAEAAEVYQRLGTALEMAAQYAGARDALDTAIGLCERTGDGSQESGCVACMAYVLRELGDWDRAAELAGELIDAEPGPGTLVVADGVARLDRGVPGKRPQGAASARAQPAHRHAARDHLDARRRRGRACVDRRA